MHSPKPVILLEFNELCPALIERFIHQGYLPNFKRLRDRSRIFTTDAQEEQEYLEPWIQWVTVHTGLGYNEHKIFNLNDGAKLEQDSIWDIMIDAGKKVWLCGSMNVKYQASPNILVLPDPWSTATKATPDELEPFFRFVQVQVQEHTNSSVPLTTKDYLNFIRFLMSHGLSISSVTQIAKQLIGEKLVIKGRWKRAVILDKLQWDVFRWYFKKHRPDFSTFFLNSTAHFQHKFWRAMEPEKFSVKPNQTEQDEYCNAILFGYKEMDRIIGYALALAKNSATIVFSSALSQQPYLKMEDSGGKRFYRPHRFEKFIEFVGLKGVKEIAPVMSEQFHIYFGTKSDAEAAAELLRRVVIDDRSVLTVQQEGQELFCGCSEFGQVSSDAQLGIKGTGKTIQFFEIFYQADSVKSGMHHSEGILWIHDCDEQHSVEPTPVPLKDALAPMILEMMGLRVPRQMTEGRIRLRQTAHS